MPPPAQLADAPAFTIAEAQQLGEDLRLRLRPRAATAA